MAVLRHAALLVAAATDYGKLNALETHESLANIVVGRRVDSTALGVAEELVQSIIRSALTDLVGVVKVLLSRVESIVNWAIGRVLRGSAIETSRSTAGVLLAVASVRTKATFGILVSTRCSGKCLQVSDHYGARVRT